MTVDADRHLLFGLIALQVGLIDQAQLVAAFQAWARDKSRPLADHLADRGALDADGRAAVEAMVSLHLKKHGGDPEKSLASIPAGRSTQQSLAAVGDAELTGTLAHLDSRATEADADRTATYSVGTATADGQRFRVLRHHAQGGLGAVFVALDSELNREVALKQILDRHADDPASRQRFLLEAEVTGGLEHPGIVPVYGLGAHTDGRPYYAMRFVRGDSLKEAIDALHADEALSHDPARRSLALRQLLRRFVDVCNAIDYAHSRGVLHRDIKPGNVIVGKHGETLVVDWGLAKPMGRVEPGAGHGERTLIPASSSGSAQTLPGSALGTPAYMSPEQAEGDLEHLGPRSDVYGLGATLYYLLTGKPPFEGNVADVIRSVQKGQFPPPCQVDPRLGPALEAICLKAMAMLPADRYPTPRALAEDIERRMADEPLSAYPEPFRSRLARWERRHKALVYGGVSVLAITALGLAVTGVVISREKHVTEQALEQASDNAERAEANMMRAIGATYQLLSQVADTKLNRFPRMEAERRSLADSAVTNFEDFLRIKPEDPILLRMADRVYRNAALIRWVTGDFAAARRAYDDAIRVREKAIGLSGEVPDDRVKLAAAYRDMASFLQESGHDQEAAPYFERARGLTDKLLADLADLPPNIQREVRRMTGWLSVRLGETALEHGDLEQARRSFHQGIDLLTPLIREPGEWYWYRIFVGLAHRGLGMIAREQGQAAVEQREFADALRIHREVRKESADPDPGQSLAVTLIRHGEGLAADPGRAHEADAAFDEAVALLDRVTDEFPGVTWYRRDRSEALLARAGRPAASGREALAERDLTEAHRLLRELAAKEPENWSYPGGVGRVEVALGRLRQRRGDAEAGHKLLDEGIGHLEQACRRRPAQVRDRKSLEEARKARGQPPRQAQ